MIAKTRPIYLFGIRSAKECEIILAAHAIDWDEKKKINGYLCYMLTGSIKASWGRHRKGRLAFELTSRRATDPGITRHRRNAAPTDLVMRAVSRRNR